MSFNLGKALTNAADSKGGKQLTGAGYAALGDYLGIDKGKGKGDDDGSIVDEPWFIPAVIGGVVVLVLLMKR